MAWHATLWTIRKYIKDNASKLVDIYGNTSGWLKTTVWIGQADRLSNILLSILVWCSRAVRVLSALEEAKTQNRQVMYMIPKQEHFILDQGETTAALAISIFLCACETRALIAELEKKIKSLKLRYTVGSRTSLHAPYFWWKSLRPNSSSTWPIWRSSHYNKENKTDAKMAWICLVLHAPPRQCSREL